MPGRTPQTRSHAPVRSYAAIRSYSALGTRWADARLVAVEGSVHDWLVRHSINVLRISLGLVFLGFGLLKYVPGASPAESLALTTTHLLTFGFVGDVVPYSVGLVLIATLECVIGLSLITGIWMRLIVYLLVAELVGIMSPVFLLPDRLFSGPYYAPTLEGQYVVKDVVLVAAAMVVATGFRGARIRYQDGRRGTAVDRD